MRTFAPVLKVESSVDWLKNQFSYVFISRRMARIWSYVLSVHFAIFVDNNNNIQVQS